MYVSILFPQTSYGHDRLLICSFLRDQIDYYCTKIGVISSSYEYAQAMEKKKREKVQKYLQRQG